MSKCNCINVTNYDGIHQCMLCGRRFIAADTVPNELGTALKHRDAQVSITGNLLIATMKVSPEEVAELKLEEKML